MKDEYTIFETENGRSLRGAGINAVGFERTNALHALDVLRKCGAAVVGGDVYSMQDDQPSLTYDNWSIEQLPGEDFLAYCQRSIAAAENFVSNYREGGSGTLYSMVIRRRTDKYAKP
jgi:hypothetical protein